jgi:hypothetical protein
MLQNEICNPAGLTDIGHKQNCIDKLECHAEVKRDLPVANPDPEAMSSRTVQCFILHFLLDLISSSGFTTNIYLNTTYHF